MATILTVDGAASMRKIVGFTLREAVYEVEEASDGSEALAKAKAWHCDLVLTDVNMPNMDGITLTRKLRGLPGYKSIPILMLTTEGNQRRHRLDGLAFPAAKADRHHQPSAGMTSAQSVLAGLLPILLLASAQSPTWTYVIWT